MSFQFPRVDVKGLKPVFLLTLVLASASLSAIAENAQADVIIFANSTSNLGNGPGSQTGTSGTVSDTGGGVLGTDSTESRSSATFGQLKAYATINDGIGGSTAGTWAWARAHFRDDFLFNAQGLTGTIGTVEMKFTIDGSLSVSRNLEAGFGADHAVLAAAEYKFLSGVNQNTYTKYEGMRTAEYAAINGTSQHEGTPFLGIEQTYVVPFTFGTTLEGVGLELFVRAEGVGYDQGERFTSIAIADLEHTANWGGFGAVRDANGSIVSNYTFSSGSGFNYALGISTVPEPNSCLLLLAAYAIGLSRRNRRSN